MASFVAALPDRLAWARVNVHSRAEQIENARRQFDANKVHDNFGRVIKALLPLVTETKLDFG
jgi:hypothetical protein